MKLGNLCLHNTQDQLNEKNDFLDIEAQPCKWRSNVCRHIIFKNLEPCSIVIPHRPSHIRIPWYNRISNRHRLARDTCKVCIFSIKAASESIFRLLVIYSITGRTQHGQFKYWPPCIVAIGNDFGGIVMLHDDSRFSWDNTPRRTLA